MTCSTGSCGIAFRIEDTAQDKLGSRRPRVLQRFFRAGFRACEVFQFVTGDGLMQIGFRQQMFRIQLDGCVGRRSCALPVLELNVYPGQRLPQAATIFGSISTACV